MKTLWVIVWYFRHSYEWLLVEIIRVLLELNLNICSIDAQKTIFLLTLPTFRPITSLAKLYACLIWSLNKWRYPSAAELVTTLNDISTAHFKLMMNTEGGARLRCHPPCLHPYLPFVVPSHKMLIVENIQLKIQIIPNIYLPNVLSKIAKIIKKKRKIQRTAQTKKTDTENPTRVNILRNLGYLLYVCRYDMIH